MKQSEKPNRPDTATTSEVERPIQLTPSNQLQLEADDALDAIKTVLHEMRRTASDGLDPRKLTADHPWVMVGSAAVAGFVSAMLAVLSKEDAALRRLERIEKALDAQAGRLDGHLPPEAGKKRRSLLGTLFEKGYEALKPTLLATLTSAITAKATASGGQYDYEQGFAEEPVVEDAVEESNGDSPKQE
jgi:hypothetical protein